MRQDQLSGRRTTSRNSHSAATWHSVMKFSVNASRLIPSKSGDIALSAAVNTAGTSPK